MTEKPAQQGADSGTGMATPVIGLVFNVKADDVGQAASLAFETASRALGAESRGLYGVSAVRFESAPDDLPDWFPGIGD